MAGDFNKLSTVVFQQKMKPAAMRIYRSLFPGCELQDLRAEGVKVHVLDKEFGIDSLLTMRSGQWISIQEKYREPSAMRFMDFTQEYMNAVGTRNESLGEWFKLGAQLYFYGWANAQHTEFEKWLLMDIPKYKLIVEKAGGLSAVGKLEQNKLHGRASFYGIPLNVIKDAVIADNVYNTRNDIRQAIMAAM